MNILFLLILWLWSIIAPKPPIFVVCLEPINDSVLNGVLHNIRQIYHADVFVNTGCCHTPDSAYNILFNVYDADIVLNHIEKQLDPPNTIKLICITNKPLIEFKNCKTGQYVYGYGYVANTECIASINDLDSNNIIKEMSVICIHELGHCYGLWHCNDSLCYMTAGNNYTSGFARCTHFCDTCKQQLYKLRSNDIFQTRP